MLEDPARDERVGEGGDAVAAAAARGAAQHVDREGPLEEFGPALALWFGAGLSFGLGLADAWRGTGPGGGPGAVGDGAAGDDGIAQGRGGGEDAEVGPLVLARVGDQGDEGGVVRDSCYDSVLQWCAAPYLRHLNPSDSRRAWINFLGPVTGSPRVATPLRMSGASLTRVDGASLV